MMDIQLKGHKRRRARVINLWLSMKVLYDQNVSISQIIETIRKPDGTKYTRQYIYKIMEKLKEV